MFTRCPACQTLFRVRPETLRAAHGQVRCGRCDTQFNALDTLAEEPEDLVATAPPDAGQPPADSDFIYVRQVQEEAEALATVAASAAEHTSESAVAEAGVSRHEVSAPDMEISPDQAAVEGGAGAIQSRGPEPLPGLNPAVLQELLLHEERATTGRGRRRAWGGLAGVLLFVLCGQWVYLQRAHLYEYPALRPLLRGLCAELGCELPLERAPERIEVVERLVRAHPRVADALLVEVTFVSRAKGPIAYPILELQLTDVSGNRMAARRFLPGEYLPAGVDAGRGLAPERPVQVSLELVAPRTEVVSFQFDFL